MDKKSTIEKLNRVELGFDVERLKYNSVKIWPIIRAYHQLNLVINSNKKASNTLKLINLFRSLFNFVESCFNYFIFDSKKSTNLKPSDVLFVFDNQSQVKDPKTRKWMNKFADSLFYYVPKKRSILSIQYSTNHKLPSPRLNKSHFLNFSYLQFLILKKINPFLTKNNRHIENFNDFSLFLKQESIDINISEAHLIKRIEKVLQFKSYFLSVLNKVNPKLIVLPVYYTNLNFGLILAAKQLNIKTVEIQHGQQGEFHPAYSHWEKYPRKSYLLHPNCFWMWSSKNKDRILKWAKESNIEVIVGGNPWINYYKKIEIPKSTSKLEGKLKKDKIKVLVSMQLVDDFFNSFIIDIMKDESHNIQWLIRMHPSQMKFMTKVTNKLKSEGCLDFELELSTKMPLFNLFNLVDFNVTFWSTVAYEAEIFNVKSIIIHPNGYNTMRDYIDKNVFAYAESKSQFLHAIHIFNFQRPSENFIEYQDSYITNAFKQILN